MSKTQQVSFIEKLKGISMSELSFTSFTKDVSTNDDGSTFVYYRLTLEKPIEKVVGSKRTWWALKQQSVNEYVQDVKEVCIAHSLIEKDPDGWEFEEADGKLTGNGKYKGDLFLDISKGGQVWLTDVKFSKMSADWRTKQNDEKLTKLFSPNS